VSVYLAPESGLRALLEEYPHSGLCAVEVPSSLLLLKVNYDPRNGEGKYRDCHAALWGIPAGKPGVRKRKPIAKAAITIEPPPATPK
jgi:hypothetical protein